MSTLTMSLLSPLQVTPYDRSTLAGLLWSDMPGPTARTNLWRELSSLRRAIRAVAYGESLLGHTVAQKVMCHFSVVPAKPIRLVDSLTPRKVE